MLKAVQSVTTTRSRIAWGIFIGIVLSSGYAATRKAWDFLVPGKE